MRQAKVFFFVAARVLMLAGAFHLGAQTAQGQAPGNPIVATAGAGGIGTLAITVNGDVYRADKSNGNSWRFAGNVFAGAPVQATETTWGRIKAERR